MQGEATGNQYDSDGYRCADRDAYRLEWGADEQYYSGFLQIQSSGNSVSGVTVHISLRGTPPGADPDDKPPGEAIQEGLVTALESIQIKQVKAARSSPASSRNSALHNT